MNTGSRSTVFWFITYLGRCALTLLGVDFVHRSLDLRSEQARQRGESQSASESANVSEYDCERERERRGDCDRDCDGDSDGESECESESEGEDEAEGLRCVTRASGCRSVMSTLRIL